MACGKPVIMYYDEAAIQRCFGRLPPFPSARTEDEILRDLQQYLDPELRAEVGRQCREWVIETHSPDLVVDIHLNVAREVTV